MAFSDTEFRSAVLQLLAGVPHISRADSEAIVGCDVAAANAAALRVIRKLVHPARIVVNRDAGADPVDCCSDRQVEVLQVRRGNDLTHFYPNEEDRFIIRDEEGTLHEVIGHRRGTLVSSSCVASTFSAFDQHSDQREFTKCVNAAGAADRRFKIDWLEGYDPTEPEVHPLIWFTPELGFGPDHARTLLELSIAQTHEIAGAADRVRITRVS